MWHYFFISLFSDWIKSGNPWTIWWKPSLIIVCLFVNVYLFCYELHVFKNILDFQFLKKKFSWKVLFVGQKKKWVNLNQNHILPEVESSLWILVEYKNYEIFILCIFLKTNKLQNKLKYLVNPDNLLRWEKYD